MSATGPEDAPRRPGGGALPALPVVEPEADEGLEDAADAPRVVLLTGAAGILGRKLRAAWAGRYELILLDADPGGDPDVVAADLALWDEAWVALFDEADAVVHLAADADPQADWPELVGPNLDALHHVFLAASAAGIDRIVFASSNHAMGAYRTEGGPIDPDLPPRPDGPYGATKLVGERLGMALARLYGTTFVALRVGWVQDGPNRPETLPDDWGRGMWLSDRDLAGLFTRAVEAELEPGAAVVANAVSANRGSRWPLDAARELLGYEPQDDAFAGAGPGPMHPRPPRF